MAEMVPAAIVARYALLEATRGGLPWLALACIAAALGLAGFLAQVAITESAQLQAAVMAALLRASAVFLVAVHVVASIVREDNDKGLELALALPISRPTWYLGKLAGFAAAGVLLATAFALPLLGWARPADLAAWWISLVAESALVAGAALLFAVVLAQTVAALAATLGLYLLARAIAAIQAIASGPLADDSPLGAAARWAVEAVALLLPRLGSVTRTEWLLYGSPPAAELGVALAGLVLYLVLLAAAGLFDFSRRNL
jgi:ABC-type transport system involved in multi-copper enzyme maturation permease subunit